jgi:3-isopropylmalate/(R)-2-methylmalate dehydratase small subunit
LDKFSRHTGIGVPLRLSNIDTDQIIPGEFCKRITRTGFEDALFANRRKESSFILNQEPYSTGSVLVAGADFGTGSSREHAVWALKDYGFRAVVSSRFADIFRGNAGNQGLVTAQVSQEGVERIWEALDAQPGLAVTVDLEERLVTCGGIREDFDIDEYTRWRLLEGLDDIGLTLRHESAIDDFEARRPRRLPTTLAR